MLVSKLKQSRGCDFASLQRLNLLQLRNVLDLIGDVKARERQESRILRCKVDAADATVVQTLEQVRADLGRLEEELAVKEHFVKEQRVHAAQANFEAEAAAAGKQVERLRSKLADEKAKVELDYRKTLQKQVARLNRRQLSLKLVEVQLTHCTRGEMYAKIARDRLRVDDQALQQLTKDVHRYRNVAMEEASKALPIRKCEKIDEEMDKIVKSNKALALEVKQLSKDAKKISIEGDEIESQAANVELEIKSVRDDICEARKRKMLLGEMKSSMRKKESRLADLERTRQKLSSALAEQNCERRNLQDRRRELEDDSVCKRIELARKEHQDLLDDLAAGKERLAAIEECILSLLTKNTDLMRCISEQNELCKPSSLLQSLRLTQRDLAKQLKEQAREEQRLRAQLEEKMEAKKKLSARLKDLQRKSRSFKSLQDGVERLRAEKQTLEDRSAVAAGAGASARERQQLVQHELLSVEQKCEQLKHECQQKAAEGLQLRMWLADLGIEQ